MSHIRPTVLALSLAIASLGAWAQTTADPAQHRAKTTNSVKDSSRQSASKAERMARLDAMDSKMKTMHAIHEQMLSAKTPQERNALMAAHMNAMREGMESINMMGPDGMGPMQGEKHFPRNPSERQQMMEKRMEMMELMMRMAMDRMPATAQ